MTNQGVRSEGQIDAVERQVSATSSDDTVSTLVALSQTFDTDTRDLWDACTNPERIPLWFAPVSGDLQQGGRFQIQDNAEGTIETCEPPRTFTATWEFQGYVSWIAVRVEEIDDARSRLSLEHTANEDPDNWAAYGPGAGGVGWDLAFLGLANHVSRGAATATEAMEWMGTSDAERFIRESSRRWADRSIEAGTPEETARAAEKRVGDMYLGIENEE